MIPFLRQKTEFIRVNGNEGIEFIYLELVRIPSVNRSNGDVDGSFTYRTHGHQLTT